MSDITGYSGNKAAGGRTGLQLEMMEGNDTKNGGGDPCARIALNYDVAPAIICALCFVFGILYTFFGYRFFKAVMFMTGFIFGSVVVYLICLEENLLPLEGKIGVAVAAGVLCGLITMLVQYVGLFMTGFHLGLFIAIAALVIMEQFYQPSTKWIPIGILFGAGLLFAILSLYFQKGCTILGTSMFGAALMLVAVDYYVELFIMVNYVWNVIKAEPKPFVCWFSWLIIGIWPLAFLVGTITQWKVTGKGFDHHEVMNNKKMKKVNLQRVRAKERRDTQHSRYRHLYQVRRCNGDVISQVGMTPSTSQSYIQSIQHKLSPAMRSLTHLATADPAAEMESTQTTLTQVP